MNKVVLIGRITRDIELRHTPKGKAVIKTGLAVNRIFKRDGGQEADFFDVVIWGAQAENANKYLMKGSKIGIVGRLETRSFDSKDGSKRYVTEVIAEEVEYLDSKIHKNHQENDFQPLDEDDDDIPF
ncbi:single-stranded DNA-binding protein [Alkalibacter mobilis]|uniref:single-stranded DNA-binding protein n=1 Tax=Alkalibacter mobilis TaxID=2787712 RepID=UPI0018A0B54F|nr:single-stranded DNA-binding protein [Alkalibacter mobilis]